MFLQQLAIDPTAPELIGLRLIFWPRRFLATKLNRGVAFKINRLLEQVLNFRNTLIHAFRIKIINFVGRF